MASNLFIRRIQTFVATGIKRRLQSTSTANIQREENSNTERTKRDTTKLSEYRFVYPEFLPDPTFEFRHKIKEKLERMDMLRRRSVLNIPEFYVGSILAVIVADIHAPGKENKFVGICIDRTYAALRATFTLRNVVEGQGIEIMYDMYNPTILSIEVLKLEKRLDDHLFYLRDALPEYSTVPFDMEPEFRREGDPVPLNPIKVKLKPLPWHAKWEQWNCKGIESTAEAPPKRQRIARRMQEPWEAYDLMKEYRRCIPEEDQVEIWQDVDAYKEKFPVKQQLWKRSLQKSTRK